MLESQCNSSATCLYNIDAHVFKFHGQWHCWPDVTSSLPSCYCCLHSPRCKFKMHYRNISWVYACLHIHVYSVSNCIYTVRSNCVSLCNAVLWNNMFQWLKSSVSFFSITAWSNIVDQRSASRGRQKPFDCVETCGDRDGADRSWANPQLMSQRWCAWDWNIYRLKYYSTVAVIRLSRSHPSLNLTQFLFFFLLLKSASEKSKMR